MSNLDNEDLLLVHREGKDYRAKVEDMATDLNINIEIDCSGGGGGSGGGDVNLDGYAKLDGGDEGQTIINTDKFECNEDSYLDHSLLKTVNGEFSSDVTVEYDVTAATFLVKDDGNNDLFYAGEGLFKVALNGSDGVEFTVLENRFLVGGKADNTLAQINIPTEINNTLRANAGIAIAGDVTSEGGFFVGDGSKLTNLPTPVLEGGLVFKGSVDTESSLPDSDNSVGDLWHTNDDDVLHAWGEDDSWHKVGSSTEINLDEYAKLLDQDQDIVARSFVAHIDDGPDKVNATSIYTGLGLAFQADIKSQGGTGPIISASNNINSQGLYIFAAYAEDNSSRTVELQGSGLGIEFYNSGDEKVSSMEFKGDGLKIDGVNADGCSATIAGSVTAAEFIGDGSKLTNLPGGDAPEYVDGGEVTLIKPDWIQVQSFADESQVGQDDGEGGTVAPGFDPSVLGGTMLLTNQGIWHAFDWGPDYIHPPFRFSYDSYSLSYGTNFEDTYFEVSTHGTVTAKKFVGDGSELTNLPTSLPDFRDLTPLS